MARHVSPDIDPATKLAAPREAASAPSAFAEALSAKDFDALADLWGNKPWAATPDFIEAAYHMAMNLPEGATILECGTGVSTLALAAAAEQKKLRLVSCEQDRLWAAETQRALDAGGLDAEILVAPIEGDWYAPALKDRLHELGAAMLVVDGPRRDPGVDRMWPIRGEAFGCNVVRPNAAVIVDDVTTVEGRGEWVSAGTDKRPWCVGRLGAKPTLVAAE